MDLATAKQKLDDLLEDMRRNPLKYLKQQTAEGQQRAQFADAPSMTAGPSGPVHEWTREEFQAYQAAHDPMKPLYSLTSANPFAVLAVATSNGDIEALNRRIDLGDGAFGVMSAMGAAKGSSAPTPAFAQPLIGSVVPPELPPGKEFGTEIHRLIGEWFEARYPEAGLVLNTRPGQTGVDIRVPQPWVPTVVGKPYAEIKPPTNYGEMSYDRQVPNWGLTPAQVQPIMYDYSGNFYMGFGKPNWQAPLSPLFPAPVTDPSRRR